MIMHNLIYYIDKSIIKLLHKTKNQMHVSHEFVWKKISLILNESNIHVNLSVLATSLNNSEISLTCIHT